MLPAMVFRMGMRSRLHRAGGSVRGTARIRDRVLAGTIFMSPHYGRAILVGVEDLPISSAILLMTCIPNNLNLNIVQ